MNISKSLLVFNTITNIFILLVLFVGGTIWADTNGVWHRSEDVRAGIFGADEGGGNYTFPDNLIVDKELKINKSLCLNGECHNNWNSVCQSWVNLNAIN